MNGEVSIDQAIELLRRLKHCCNLEGRIEQSTYLQMDLNTCREEIENGETTLAIDRLAVRIHGSYTA